MELYYDLHIHSALSPCGDNDMTPNNIVNMSIIKGLDIIAVTDHNSCGNVRAVMKAAGDKLLVIPGMEVETSEEIHVVCYFKNIEDAEKMWEIVKSHMNNIKNREEIYGEQLYMNEFDEVTAKEELLLVSATTMSIYEVIKYAKDCGGIAVPAHIDRSSYSVLANLGAVPEDLNIKALEITKKNRAKLESEYKNYRIISNSDAHYLEDISEPEFTINIMSKTAENVLRYLCKIE